MCIHIDNYSMSCYTILYYSTFNYITLILDLGRGGPEAPG